MADGCDKSDEASYDMSRTLLTKDAEDEKGFNVIPKNDGGKCCSSPSSIHPSENMGKERPKQVKSLHMFPGDDCRDENCHELHHDDNVRLRGACTCMDNYLLKTLDEMEKRTEKLRQTVKEAETERLHLLESLNTLMQSQALVAAGERDELELYMDRLTNRLLTVNISVEIFRTPPQEESFHLVKTLLGKLQKNLMQGETDPSMTRRYLNSCMAEASGPVDDAFQGALLGCAVEDQKEIRKMLTLMWEARGDIDRQLAVLSPMNLA
ncbi:BAG family molecular chaperone regulator 2-like [Acanthaster planci]|uniref:BAG family molecular chaperone regulator 2-like n=1 Tax=Acanthaster planci TaxID=133434 RepID=A0A8B7ZW86_ACAPL|nr:BAG family molecular chaperone regulator 2-like [Acanthaster planci]XP_022107796.1 BAG family molecular chaperone regulator 2-like [Acanthaster planci]